MEPTSHPRQIIPFQVGGSGGRYRVPVSHFEVDTDTPIPDPVTWYRARGIPMEVYEAEKQQPADYEERTRNQNNLTNLSETNEQSGRSGLQRQSKKRKQAANQSKLDRATTKQSSQINVSSGDPAQFYQLGEPEVQHVKRFKTSSSTYPFVFRNIEKIENFYKQIPEIFDHAVEHVMEGAAETDYVGVELTHPTLHVPVLIPFQHRNKIQGSQLLHVLQRVLQSNEHLNLNDNQLKVRIVKVSPPSGMGHHSRQHVNLDTLRKIKKSIVRIKNTDELCLARAIVVAKTRLEHLVDPDNNILFHRYQNMCRPDTPKIKMQLNAATELMEAADLANQKESCGIAEIQAIQDILPDYQIRIFNSQTPGSLSYSGPPATHCIDLYNHDNHFDVITSLPAFFNNSYYCSTCNVAYSNKDRHQCATICPCCHEAPACPNVQFEDSIKCPTCNRYFRGENCFQNHTKHSEQKTKKNTTLLPSICERLQICGKCEKHLRGIKNIQEHKCDHFKCRTCNEIVPIQDHLCYMQPLDPRKELVDGPLRKKINKLWTGKPGSEVPCIPLLHEQGLL